MTWIASIIVDDRTKVEILLDGDTKEILYRIQHWLPFGLEIVTVKDKKLLFARTDLDPAKLNDIKLVI